MDEHQVFLRPPVWLPIVVALLVGGSYIAGKHIEVREPPATITVSGEGKVSAAPDIAMLTFGVQTGRQKTAQAAMEMLTKSMNAVIDAVEKSGVEKKDVSTQNLWLSPAYDYQDGRQVDKGFEANQQLTVKVRDFDKITTVLDAAVRTGANDVNGVQFTIDDPAELQAQARTKALEKAKVEAKRLADALGMTLGELRGYSEGGGGYPQPMMMRASKMEMGMAADSFAPEIPAGEQDVNVNVSVTYEVK